MDNPPLRIILEADLAEGQELPEGAMEAAQAVIEHRLNNLGLTRSTVQRQDNNQIRVELFNVSNPELTIKTIHQTGLLEFVDAGHTSIPEGTLIKTSLSNDLDPASKVYETIITSGDLDQISNAGINSATRLLEINFSLKPEGQQNLSDYTGANVGNFLCIVLDKVVLSCPRVSGRIDSNGVITLPDTSLEEGQTLSIQLRSGALPVPLKVISVSE